MTSVIFRKEEKIVKNFGIVCEYNPFHNGHAKQLAQINAPICLMSGNFVQRGEPAIIDKYTRAKAAIACGASLVLELPITHAIASAEGFADGAVEIFSRLGCVDGLCFGSENGDIKNIMSTAKALLSPEFSDYLRAELEMGVSFPVARQRALQAMGADNATVERPNDILAVEYCKAILKRNSPMEPVTICREGDYHGGSDTENPSASFLRTTDDWINYMPREAYEILKDAPRHTVDAGERAWLARLRFMSECDFEELPFGSEGLWRKLMHACRSESTLEQILQAVKSKRYTHTRLMRLLLCAFLGITQKMMDRPAPYVRVLGFNDEGRTILRKMRQISTIPIINAGEIPPDADYWELERRASDLYGLFSKSGVSNPSQETNARVFYDSKLFDKKSKKTLAFPKKV